jgi:hypothetical protein
VPYLHVTTRLDNVPYDKLLGEKGFGSFPTLAFMDHEGNVIGQPSDRTVAAFASTRDALIELDAVRKRADAGDPVAAVELLFLEFTLGKIKTDALEAGVANLAEHATPAQLARVKQVVLDARIYALYMAGYRGEEPDMVGKMASILASGQTPTPGSPSCSLFWKILGVHAQVTGNTKLLRRVATGMRADMPSDARLQTLAGHYEVTALGLDKRDALIARQAAGEEKLAAQILLIEARLEAIDFASFRERLGAAMAAATPEQKTELAQADVDLEVKHLSDSYSADADKQTIQLRALALLETNPTKPSADLVGLLRGPIYDYARSITDPERLDGHAEAISKRQGPDSPAQDLVKMVAAMAEGLRKVR